MIFFFFPLFFFQMTVVVGVGVTLSCFKVKVPFIVAIKHSRCGRKKALEHQGRARYGEKEKADGIMVQANGFIILKRGNVQGGELCCKGIV